MNSANESALRGCYIVMTHDPTLRPSDAARIQPDVCDGPRPPLRFAMFADGGSVGAWNRAVTKE